MLEQDVGTGGNNLSVGERQLLAIARVLLRSSISTSTSTGSNDGDGNSSTNQQQQQPACRIFVMDEPTVRHSFVAGWWLVVWRRRGRRRRWIDAKVSVAGQFGLILRVWFYFCQPQQQQAQQQPHHQPTGITPNNNTNTTNMNHQKAHIDPATDAALQRVMRTEFKGATLITIAHRLHTVADFDQVIVMMDGNGGDEQVMPRW
jgi:hypothetical protein